MAGGNGITMRVSAALRAAELPVARYTDRIGQSRNGIVVRQGPLLGTASISFRVPDDRDHERVLADQVEAVLTAKGFTYERHEIDTVRGTAPHFWVYSPNHIPQRLQPAPQTVAEAPVRTDIEGV